MLKTIKVTKENLEYAIRIQEEIFPDESGRVNYEEAIAGTQDYDYYLLYQEENCVGVIGLYTYPCDAESAWLGWFGIREKFRKKHLGTEAIKKFEDLAEKKGYKYARLYTDEADNDVAIAFYQSNGYTCEKYVNEDDPACLQYRMLIFSKSLCGEPFPLWNNKNIHLTEQIEKQKSGQCKKADERVL